MALPARKKSSVNKDAWLNTYADMITLILVFFVLLYSMSSLDKGKYEMLVKAFTTDPDVLEQLMQMELDEAEQNAQQEIQQGQKIEIADVEDLDDLYQYLSQYIEENELQNSVQIEKNDNVVYIRFMSSLFFEPDLAVLKATGVNVLAFVGEALGQVEAIAKFIRIDGHTAEAPAGGSTVNNRDLSTERANVVLKYLEANFIKDPSKLYAVGYGMYRPVAPNDIEANRAKNRRVEILVGKEDPLQDELDQLYEQGNQEPANP